MLEDGICCPETSVRNHHSTLRNNPEERRSRLHQGGSLKSRITLIERNNNTSPLYPGPSREANIH